MRHGLESRSFSRIGGDVSMALQAASDTLWPKKLPLMLALMTFILCLKNDSPVFLRLCVICCVTKSYLGILSPCFH